MAQADVHVPVLIVGGGGAGLTASMLLSTYGVESLLVSSLPTTSILPKAHVLDQRAMEVFRDVGLAEAVYEHSCPPEQMSHTAWYLDIAGDDEHAGRLVHKLESWGAGYTDPHWVQASPCAQANLPQIRLEPLMLERAEELSPNGIRFNHELIALEQDNEGVTATVRDNDAGTTYVVRAQYVLGCDGGRTVGKLVGVELDGQRDVMRTATVHMTADLSPWQRDDDVLIRWVLHTRFGGAFSVLVPMGPTHWGPSSEEWVFHLNYPVELDEMFDTDEKVMAILRDRAGLPDLDIDVHVITRWSVEGLIAPTMKVDRVLLVGDAAHRHPPTGGLGLNSAVLDAQNLCWKLAAVLRGSAGPALLDTYHEERWPSVFRNMQRSIENALNHLALVEAMGIGADPDESRRNALELWQDGPAGDARRERVFRAMATQSMEFNEHNVEYGFVASSPAIVPDGTPEPINADDVRVYQPGTRPGSPLPHAWVERVGERVPLREVAPTASFTLIAGEDGGGWCDAARDVAARRGVELVAVRVGHLDGDWLDPRLSFVRVREFGGDGAILVRPDRVVAWRAFASADDPAAVLEEVFDQVLAPLRTPLALAT